MVHIGQDTFHHQFGHTVRVNGIFRMVLVNRYISWLPKDRSARREYEVLRSMRMHCLQKRQRVHYAVTVITIWPFQGFADLNIGGEVDYTIELLARENGVEQALVSNIALHQHA